MQYTDYRMEISHLAGETIYRCFRYIRDGKEQHKEFAPGIHSNAKEAYTAMKKLNAAPPQAKRIVTDEEARKSLIRKARAKRAAEVEAKQLTALAQIVTIGSLYTLLVYAMI